MADETYNSSAGDLSAFFGDAPAPADFNPDARAFEQAPAGDHLMEVHDFDITKEAKTFKAKVDGVSYEFRYYQLRPKLRIVGGAHDGASVMDFLPIPPKQGDQNTSFPMVGLHANEWANFIKALGFELPPGKLLPVGFNPAQMKGRRCMVKIVNKMKDGQQELDNNGEPKTEVKFFGYSRPGATTAGSPAPAPSANGTPAPSSPAPNPGPAAAAPAPAPVTTASTPGDFDL